MTAYSLANLAECASAALQKTPVLIKRWARPVHKRAKCAFAARPGSAKAIYRRHLSDYGAFRRNMAGKVAAIVVAAGRGLRAAGDLPKQYRRILGEPVIRP